MFVHDAATTKGSRIMVFRVQFVALAALLALAGCSTTAKAPDETPLRPAAYAAGENAERASSFSPSSLAGRTLSVTTVSDIRLGPKEVVLTFDDGPAPGRTTRILDALDRAGVKATFLMVGQMAERHPALARSVAARGHSIGSHTQRHPNLARMGFSAATAEIERGEAALRRAGIRNAGFFRFPYLADTASLRRHLAGRGLIVLDVDIDSKDYFRLPPQTLIEQTMRKVRARGRGVILFHDLHDRTAVMLPGFLAALTADGYKVVSLKPKRGLSLLVADAD
jgi:peptidoglycan-N-acetylglucosamine deacetylase